MHRYLLIVIFWLFNFLPDVHGQHGMAGIFERDSSWLSLNCDSTFRAYSLSGRDSVKLAGMWSTQDNNILLRVDSLWTTDFMKKNITLQLVIKQGTLSSPKLTRSEYRQIKRAAKREYHPRRVEPFAEYKKNYNKKLLRTTSFHCNHI